MSNFVRLVSVSLVLFAVRASGVTFTVTHVSESGAGSLRQAITDANARAGLDRIEFQIPGDGVHTIVLLSALPTITSPLEIDGYSQPGASSNTLMDGNNAVLLIELNGALAGSSANGLTISAGSSTVRGLVINSFQGHGIRIESNGGNEIAGNFIGTDSSGTIALPNGTASTDFGKGVLVASSLGNVIGGATPAARNLISGNLNDGVALSNVSNSNSIQGNFIGVNASGTVDLGNRRAGIWIYGSASNVIGGEAEGARNVISGNDIQGIGISNNSSNNYVKGNFIGTDVHGAAAISNSSIGVQVTGSANIIGGTNAFACNVISGNGDAGIKIQNSTAFNNVVQGNYIGTDATGTLALGNNGGGIHLNAGTNLVGGSIPGARNIISGNLGAGLILAWNIAVSNTIEGNFVGIDVSGSNALGNAGSGIAFFYSAGSNTIGGTSGLSRNVISANSTFGVYIASSSSGYNTIQGCYIGTDRTGTQPRGNGDSGIRIEMGNNVVGGGDESCRNVISANANGIHIHSATAVSNLVEGNYIGVDASGRAALGNRYNGVILSACSGNLVGGVRQASRNVIGSSGTEGVYIHSSASRNRVLGNAIGTDATGIVPLGNSWRGIEVRNATNIYIGDISPGSSNTIAYNADEGIRVYSNAMQITIRGNNIYSNGSLGIDLTTSTSGSVTQNDSCDNDGGPNGRQNYPVLQSSVVTNSLVVMEVTLNSQPNRTYAIDFYGHDVADPAGYGEGQRYIGSTNVTTDGSCSARFSYTLPPGLWGDYITATATDPEGNTSEFSQATRVIYPVTILTQPQSQVVGVGAPVSMSVTVAGLPPYTYRWLFEGQDLPGHTGSSVFFPSVQPSHAGTYQVLVTNSLGAATSEVATLTVNYFSLSGYAWNDLNVNGKWERLLIKGTSPDVVFVVDASSSTTNFFLGSEVGDVNGDGRTNTILDGELAGLMGLNNALIQKGLSTDSRVAVVAFSTSATNLDMNPVLVGVQLAAASGADENADGVPDVVEALRSIRHGFGTYYGTALQAAQMVFNTLGTPDTTGNLVFISDGEPSDQGTYSEEATALRDMGINLRAFGAGTDATLSTLRVIDPAAQIFTNASQLVEFFLGYTNRDFLGEPGLGGVVVYVDDNLNAELDTGEIMLETSFDNPLTTGADETGYFIFTNLVYGNWVVRQLLATNWALTYPPEDGAHHLRLTNTFNVAGLNFGNAAETRLWAEMKPETSEPEFTLRCAAGFRHQIEATTNFIAWTTLTNIQSSNTWWRFRDPDWSQYSYRFYRAVAH